MKKISDTKFMVFRVKDVADLLLTNGETIRLWIKKGRLKAISLGSNKGGYRITKDSLDDFLNKNPKYYKIYTLTAAEAASRGELYSIKDFILEYLYTEISCRDYVLLVEDFNESHLNKMIEDSIISKEKGDVIHALINYSKRSFH